MRLLLILVALAVLLPLPSLGHEVRPAYLDLREDHPGEFSVLWKTPMLGDLRLSLDPVFSGPVEVLTPVATQRTGNAAVQTWRLRTESLHGQTLRIAGLETNITDALVRASFLDGSTWIHRLTPQQPGTAVPSRPSAWGVAGTYLTLGVEHILMGIDHLLFVLALLLLTTGTWRLVKTVTAFTVAHSITLGLATLGIVHVPSRPVEAVIALSIVFVAAEIVQARRGRAGLAAQISGEGADAAIDIIRNFSQGTISKAIFPLPGTAPYRGAWQETIAAAEANNDPGRFTAFIGFEWTSNTGGNNLHRNVIFRDNADKAGQVEPFTTMKPLGSDNPRDLWNWMAAYEEKTGGRMLAIAHNGNLSNGVMFPIIESFTGRPVDRQYAEQRARWERLYEVTQMKGTGEAHPLLSPTDEFANFEIWDKANLDMSVAKTPDMLEFEYARSALKNGLKLEQELGTNPYKFGMVGSTDAHTGLTTAEEENFFGKVSSGEPTPERLTATFMANPASGRKIMDWEVSSAGYAAVWATDNTRASLWDAMQRRETYGTTGPRMIVRFFGGWDFVAQDADSRLPAQTGYTKGVPMGGDLGAAPQGKSPTFLVAALKDALGANLDRYQIVKGWLTKDGKVEEKIYDVAWADAERRRPGGDGKLPAVGNTVDVANATWTNTIGAPELATVWTDPDFDPTQPAFYYGRVIEIPTPRWTAYDAKRFGTKPLPATVMTVTERAYTSPIWYTPE